MFLFLIQSHKVLTTHLSHSHFNYTNLTRMLFLSTPTIRTVRHGWPYTSTVEFSV